jgi:hypothetical protein
MPSSSNNRNVARIRDWLPADLLSFAGAAYHGAALSSSGEVWLWGFSHAGNQGLINPDPANNRRTWYDPHTVEGFELAVELQVPKESWGDGTCILTRTGRIQCVGRFSDPAYYHLQDATRVVGLNGYEAPPAP